MGVEKLDPTNPEHKKVKGGFITKEAAEADNIYKEKTKNINAGRSLFEKLFFLNKTSKIDLAHEDALTENKHINALEEIEHLEDTLGRKLSENEKEAVIHLFEFSDLYVERDYDDEYTEIYTQLNTELNKITG